MSVVTLASLYSKILGGLDIPSTHVSSSLIYEDINRSLGDVYDMLVGTHEDYFHEVATVSTSTAVDYVSLPDGWHPEDCPPCLRLDRIVYPYGGRTYDILPMAKEEYSAIASPDTGVSLGQDLRWLLRGNKVVFQGVPSAAFDLKMWYVPTFHDLQTLLLSSPEDFGSSSWTKLDTARDVVSPHAIANPVNGKRNADGLIAYTSNVQHGCTQVVTLTAAQYVFYVYFKAGSKTWAFIQATPGAGSAYAYLNLGSGATGTTSNCRAFITAKENGWYKGAIAFTGTAAPWTIHVSPADADNDNQFAGDASTVSCYMFGAKLHLGNYPQPYWMLTDSVAWDVPINWTNYVCADVSAKLCTAYELDATPWIADRENARRTIMSKAPNRVVGSAQRVIDVRSGKNRRYAASGRFE